VKQVYIFLAILLVATLILGSCAQPAPAPAPAPAPTPAPAPELPVAGMKPGEENLYFEYTWTSATTRTAPPPGFERNYNENFFDALEKATQGRFKVKYAYGGILGSARELPHLVSAGVCEMAALTGPDAATYTYLSLPTEGWFTGDLPTDMKLAGNLYKHPLSLEIFDRMNLVYIGHHMFGANALMIRKGVKPIATAEDLKGLQLGVWSEVAKLWASEVGMIPISTYVYDSYEGMMKGMFDGVIIGWTGFKGFKLYELTGQSIVTAAGGNSPMFNFMNKDAWNRLPQYIKDLWWELYPTEFEEYYIRYQLAQEQLGLDLAKENEVKILRLPAADEAKLVAAAKPAWADWVAEMLKYPGGKQVKEFLKDQIASRDKLIGEPWTLYTP